MQRMCTAAGGRATAGDRRSSRNRGRAERKTNTRTLRRGGWPATRRSKTVTVLVERARAASELYGKYRRARRKQYRRARPKTATTTMGDLVEIAEGRPISKTKSWTVTKLLEKAKLV